MPTKKTEPKLEELQKIEAVGSGIPMQDSPTPRLTRIRTQTKKSQRSKTTQSPRPIPNRGMKREFSLRRILMHSLILYSARPKRSRSKQQLKISGRLGEPEKPERSRLSLTQGPKSRRQMHLKLPPHRSAPGAAAAQPDRIR